MNGSRITGKSYFFIIFLAFLIVSVPSIIAGQTIRGNYAYGVKAEPSSAADSQTVSAKPDSAQIPVAETHQVLAYYFHGTRRCANCFKIESYTKEAIDSNFVSALKDSLLIFKIVNIDEKEYNHFIDDYKLYTKSVVLVDLHNGKQARWKNLEKVWDFLDDKAGFKKYITDEVNVFLKAE